MAAFFPCIPPNLAASWGPFFTGLAPMIPAVERVILVINHTGPRSCSLEGYNADGDDGVDIAIFCEQHPIRWAREYAELKYGVSDAEVVDPDAI
jgi:hypothetical protein